MSKKYTGNHTSTEVPERFYHIKLDCGLRGTVFMREYNGLVWVSCAITSPTDNFCRKTGRTIARRKWFAAARYPSSAMSYETAKGCIEAEAARTVLRRWQLVTMCNKIGVVSDVWMRK